MEKEQKNLLVFGYGLAVILTMIASRMWMKHGFSPWQLMLLGIAVALCVLTFINVQWIKPLYVRWMRVANIIGHVVSSVVLGFIFYGGFGLIGSILRVLKKDLLNQKITQDAASYWIQRQPDGRDLSRYTRQY